jgi:copper chaperone
MEKITWTVPGISCGHCVNTIETELAELEGVIRVKADASSKAVVVEYQPPASEEKLVELMSAINYPVKFD